MIGRRVHNFEITRCLGQGGMGAVYEAVHSVLSRRVAIKVLRRELAADRDIVQRFFNEARATSAVRHPSFVEVIDAGTLPEGVPYLTMELLEGETLAARLARRGRLARAEAVELAAQVAGALHVAHAAGIVHRDVKPEHLFVVRDEFARGGELVKILDFGIAKLRRNVVADTVQTNAGAILGTPVYMSPEQCRGVAGLVDHRADIYALGVTLYELLCGAPPFVGPGVGEIMKQHLGVEPEPPSRRRADVGPELDRVVLKALAKAPEARFATMAELAEALRACASEPATSVQASPARAARGVGEAGFASRRAALAFAAVACFAVVGATIFGQRGAGAPEAGGAPARASARQSTPASEPPRPSAAMAALGAEGSTGRAPGELEASTSTLPLRPALLAQAGTSPAPSAPAPGYLSLDSVPWANVYVGERLLGATPLERIALPPGRHELRIENPELDASVSYVVEIEPGSSLSRFIDWHARRTEAPRGD